MAAHNPKTNAKLVVESDKRQQADLERHLEAVTRQNADLKRRLEDATCLAEATRQSADLERRFEDAIRQNAEFQSEIRKAQEFKASTGPGNLSDQQSDEKVNRVKQALPYVLMGLGFVPATAVSVRIAKLVPFIMQAPKLIDIATRLNAQRNSKTGPKPVPVDAPALGVTAAKTSGAQQAAMQVTLDPSSVTKANQTLEQVSAQRSSKTGPRPVPVDTPAPGVSKVKTVEK